MTAISPKWIGYPQKNADGTRSIAFDKNTICRVVHYKTRPHRPFGRRSWFSDEATTFRAKCPDGHWYAGRGFGDEVFARMTRMKRPPKSTYDGLSLRRRRRRA